MSGNKKIIFIDRDGVINKDPGGWTEHSYVTKPEEFIFLPRSKEALKKLTEAGYDVIVISNQGGISKGYCTEKDLDVINKKLLKELEKAGGKLKKVYYCIHQDSDNCECRKPKTGLFERARKELGTEIKGAYFIGDGRMDVEAGNNAGLKTILLLSGKTNLEDIRRWDVKPDFIFDNLEEAVDFVVKGEYT